MESANTHLAEFSGGLKKEGSPVLSCGMLIRDIKAIKSTFLTKNVTLFIVIVIKAIIILFVLFFLINYLVFIKYVSMLPIWAYLIEEVS